jgi:DNA-binding LacI/PurR family transcriptional regulator
LARSANGTGANLARDGTLTQRVVDEVRAGIESGELGLADVLLSERELAERHGVSRVTARRALRILVRDGYLVSLPRQGYRLVTGTGKTATRDLIALVRGERRGASREWGEFAVRLWDACHRAAVELGRDLWAVSMEERSLEDISGQVAGRGVTGAVVTGDEVELARALGREKVPAVLIDAAHPEVESVTVDFFRGAYELTSRLIASGHRRLACLCYDPYGTKDTVQVRERLGGFTAAMACAGLAVRAEWVLFAREPGQIGREFADLLRAKNGPGAAVVLWPQLLEEVGEAIDAAAPNTELAAWWGADGGAREDWAKRHPNLPVPDGVQWDVMELARRALEQLSVACSGAERVPGRTMVPVKFVAGTGPAKKEGAK